jgi:hypothetical protein
MAAFSEQTQRTWRMGPNTGDGTWVYYYPDRTVIVPWSRTYPSVTEDVVYVETRAKEESFARAARLAQLLAWTRQAIAQHEARARSERPGRRRTRPRAIVRRARVCSMAGRYRVML